MQDSRACDSRSRRTRRYSVSRAKRGLRVVPTRLRSPPGLPSADPTALRGHGPYRDHTPAICLPAQAATSPAVGAAWSCKSPRSVLRSARWRVAPPPPSRRRRPPPPAARSARRGPRLVAAVAAAADGRAPPSSRCGAAGPLAMRVRRLRRRGGVGLTRRGRTIRSKPDHRIVPRHRRRHGAVRPCPSRESRWRCRRLPHATARYRRVSPSRSSAALRRSCSRARRGHALVSTGHASVKHPTRSPRSLRA
jgi:hypothetical protein